MPLQEDPGFLRLFFQAIFDIVIKPIQGAWRHREKTIHGYLAAILAIGIFLYFLIVGLYNSFNYFYGMFYEDHYYSSIKEEAISNLNILYSDFCTNAKDVFHPALLTNTGTQKLFVRDDKGDMPCSKRTSNDKFFALTVEPQGATGAVKVLFLRKDPQGRYFFQSVSLKKSNFFWWKIYGIDNEGKNLNIQIY